MFNIASIGLSYLFLAFLTTIPVYLYNSPKLSADRAAGCHENWMQTVQNKALYVNLRKYYVQQWIR